jgi:hypothetical protein
MAAVALAVVGKNNEPLYIKTFLREESSIDEPAEEELFSVSSPSTTTGSGGSTTTPSPTHQRSLRHQFILHAALDRFEKLSGPYPGCAWREQHPGVAGNDAMFVGLLCPVEDLRVYGTSLRVSLSVTWHRRVERLSTVLRVFSLSMLMMYAGESLERRLHDHDSGQVPIDGARRRIDNGAARRRSTKRGRIAQASLHQTASTIRGIFAQSVRLHDGPHLFHPL